MAPHSTTFLLWIAFWLGGLVSGVCALSLQVWARLTLVVWNVILLCSALAVVFNGHEPASPDLPWLAISASVAVYVLVFAVAALVNAYRLSGDQLTASRRQGLMFAAVAFAWIGLRLVSIVWHAQHALALTPR
jgi:hypothetical protein